MGPKSFFNIMFSHVNTRNITLCLKKNRTLEIFSNIFNKTGPISIIFFLVQRIANKYASIDAYYFAICCKTEYQLTFSTGNQS